MKTKMNGKETQIAEFLTIAQVIRGSGKHGLPISRRTLDRYKAKGILRAYKLNGKTVFNMADVERFIKSRSTGGNVPAAPIMAEPELAPVDSRILSDDQAKTFFETHAAFLEHGNRITEDYLRKNPR